MRDLLADVVATVFRLPTWAPRALRRSAALTLAVVVVLAPDSFKVGVARWVQIETQVIMERMAPLLQSLDERLDAPDVAAPK
jgi:hypothetical protein